MYAPCMVGTEERLQMQGHTEIFVRREISIRDSFEPKAGDKGFPVRTRAK